MGLVLMAAAAWVFFLVAVSSAGAAAFPWVRRPLARLHPSSRAAVLRGVATAPVGLATFGVLLCFAPKLFGQVFSRVDHCFQHGDEHPHFCLNHPPQVSFSAESWVGLAVLGLAVGVVVGVQSARFRRSARLLRQLAATARFDGRRRAWLIESDLPIAMSVGVLRPRTLLSSRLLQMVPARLVDAIVAHEEAHERRRDGLWKPVTELLSFGLLPRTRRLLLSDLELACEQACDEEAGAVFGDRTRVAEALIAMERLRQSTVGFGPAALAFGAHGLPARVESLVGDPPERRGNRQLTLALLVTASTIAVAAADPLHHLTETLIHYVLG